MTQSVSDFNGYQINSTKLALEGKILGGTIRQLHDEDLSGITQLTVTSCMLHYEGFPEVREKLTNVTHVTIIDTTLRTYQLELLIPTSTTHLKLKDCRIPTLNVPFYPLKDCTNLVEINAKKMRLPLAIERNLQEFLPKTCEILTSHPKPNLNSAERRERENLSTPSAPARKRSKPAHHNGNGDRVRRLRF